MEKYKLLFVCMGNICRSPAAEGIMKSIINKNNYSDLIEVDSAGTIDYHSGELPDARMRRHARNRGYELVSRARVFTSLDFKSFDKIIVMDNENYADVTLLTSDENDINKVFKLTDFCTKHKIPIVPDPYYGGDSGFEHVLDLLEDGCENLFNIIKKEIESKNSK